jgi:signal transduction histidine kinase
VFPRLASALFAGAPVLLLILVVGGLYAADRTLSQTDRVGTHSDAATAAARTERFLDIHVEAMRSFHGLFARSDRIVSAQHFNFLVAALGPHVTGFRRIWIADKRGVVVLDTVIRPTSSPSLQGADIDTIVQLDLKTTAARARETHRIQVSAAGQLFGEDTGFVMMSPVMVGDSVVGMVLASVLMNAILDEVLLISSPPRRGVAIVVRGDTIAARLSDDQAFSARRDSAPITAPDDTKWSLHVTHAVAGWAARVALWAIGLAAAATLIAGSIRERQHSRRIAERSQELEHLSTELLYANRAKSEFLANVSHELRTPLNAIVGFVDLLRDGVYGELAPRQIGPVDRIAASASHLRHLVDQVLDLAKITAGRLEVHTDVVDLRSFVLDIAGEMEPLITERGLALSVAVGATLPRLRTDPVHLRQILVNLLGNAIKYTNAGSIIIRARLIGGIPDSSPVRTTPDTIWLQPLVPPASGLWIAAQVVDTGIGIAEHDFERIFDEFEQVGAGPRGKSMQRGTGLGLSISRRLARLLGGDIVVESELGKGSVFTLWLPVDPADLKSSEDHRSARELLGTHRSVAG